MKTKKSVASHHKTTTKQSMINESIREQLFESILAGVNDFIKKVKRGNHEKSSNL